MANFSTPPDAGMEMNMSVRSQLPATGATSHDGPSKAEALQGTHILPMPANTPTVAGMPRRGRALSDPGDPGVIKPEDDVYGNDPADLSLER